MEEYQLRMVRTWHDLESFEHAIVLAWESVTSDADMRRALFSSMPNRLKQYITTRGELVE